MYDHCLQINHPHLTCSVNSYRIRSPSIVHFNSKKDEQPIDLTQKGWTAPQQREIQRLELRYKISTMKQISTKNAEFENEKKKEKKMKKQQKQKKA